MGPPRKLGDVLWELGSEGLWPLAGGWGVGWKGGMVSPRSLTF